ncbi:MAG: GNAT family N-acetyltransferase [Actinomycetota bacterium]|nr:GNAT family N-acetyltransferase [Actinomycetota bacterium]
MRFVPMTMRDLAMFAEWLRRPHVAEWWTSPASEDEVRAEYSAEIEGGSTSSFYIAHVDDVPIGFIQSYVAAGSGDGWWSEETDPGVRGIDQFIADPTRLSQGLGTQMIKEFTEMLFAEPGVTRIQADPDPRNTRAIRSYGKAGFRPTVVVATPDGDALLMILDRPAPGDVAYR